METKKTPIEVRELDQRSADRLTITLWWVVGTMQTYVSIEDERYGDGESQFVGVEEGERPLDVFQHPFSYQWEHEQNK